MKTKEQLFGKEDGIMGKWYNWFIGPTGYVETGKKIGDEEQYISMQGSNPTGALLTGEFDWKKFWEGAKTGASWGGGYSPGWGHLIGGLIGGGMGGMWVGDKDNSESGMAMASQGKAEGGWAEGNDTWKALNTAVGLFNMAKGGKGSGSGNKLIDMILKNVSWNNNQYGLGDLVGLAKTNDDTEDDPNAIRVYGG